MTLKKLATFILLILLIVFFLKSETTSKARVEIKTLINRINLGNLISKNPSTEKLPFSETEINNALINIDDLEYERLGVNPPPPVNKPNFTSWASAGFDEDELIIGIDYKGNARAYPYYTLYRHKIINDTIAGEPIIITYSPTCDTNPVFLGTVNGEKTNFKDTGILYQGCMVMEDTASKSYWSQPWGLGIIGNNANTPLTRIVGIKTTLGKWKDNHPDTLVLPKATNVIRDYLDNPYDDYQKTEEISHNIRNTEMWTGNLKEPISYIWLPGLGEKFNKFDGQAVYFKNSFVKNNKSISLIFNSQPMTAVWDDNFETMRFLMEDGREMPASTGYAFAYFALFK